MYNTQFTSMKFVNNFYNIKTKTLVVNFIENSLSFPLDIKCLIFKNNIKDQEYRKFHHLIDNLPASLTNLTFGKHYNSSIDKLPSNLIYLTFNNNFNNVKEYLPKTLYYPLYYPLTFWFNRPPINHEAQIIIFIDNIEIFNIIN